MSRKTHWDLCFSLKSKIDDILDGLEAVISAEVRRPVADSEPAEGHFELVNKEPEDKKPELGIQLNETPQEYLERMKAARSPHVEALDVLDNHLKGTVDKLRFVREMLCGRDTEALVEPLIGENECDIFEGLRTMLVDPTMGYDRACAEISAIPEESSLLKAENSSIPDPPST